MKSIYNPEYHLFIIPIEDFKDKLKTWFKTEKEIEIDFSFSYEYPEYGFSKMGDLSFHIKEENMSPADLEKLKKLYINYSSDEIVGIYIFKPILKDFFNVTYIHYDVDVNREEIHIRTKIAE